MDHSTHPIYGLKRLHKRLTRLAEVRGRLLRLILLCSVVGTLRAQQSSCLDRTIAVNVISQDGDFVQGLTPKNFDGRLRRQRVDTLSVIRDTSPRRIVIVLDASGSMSDKWRVEVGVAEGLWKAEQGASFALLTFATHADCKVDFGGGRTRVAEELIRLEAEDWTHYKGPPRKTALLDALIAAIGLLRPAQLGDSIFLVSDAGDNKSEKTASEVKDALVNSGVRLFALMPVDPRMAANRINAAEDGFDIEGLQDFAKITGGDSITLSLAPNDLSIPDSPLKLSEADRQTISSAVRQFENEIAEFYRLTIKLPEEPQNSRRWKLQVVDSNGKWNPRWYVVYPQLLAPCP